MEFRHLVLLSALFCFAVLGSHVQASLPAEDYWQTLWPNTPMPKALRDLLQPDAAASSYQTGYGKVNDPKRSKAPVPNGLFVFEHERSDESDTVAKPFPSDFSGKGSDLTRSTYVKPQLFFYAWDKASDLKRNTYVKPQLFFYAWDKASDLTRRTDAKPQLFFYSWDKASDLTRSKDTVPNGTFFFEHDLLPGKKLNLEPTKPSDEFTFLPDTVAKTIPFSSTRLPEILNRLGIKAKSTDAETVKQMIEICERPSMNGEEKYCATSLESLVNFAISKLGKNTRLLSTEFEKGTQNRQYSVVEGVKKNGDKAVVCHKMEYPYAVFYCHKIDTRSYTVPLVATGDGTKAKALAVCHTDTTPWHPEHVAFKQLNVKPGTIPICHFLVTDTILWVPNLASKWVMEGDGMVS